MSKAIITVSLAIFFGINTLVAQDSTTVIDIDGNVYKTVIIGDQEWMVENLRVTHYQNGEPIPNVKDSTEWINLSSGAYAAYNNDDSLAAIYGYLYNWYAVADTNNIAPQGWHVPNHSDWLILEMNLGISFADAIGSGYRGTDEGGKLKETGYDHWLIPNTGATNSSGFTALPGGLRHYRAGSFHNLGVKAYFWTSDPDDDYKSIFRSLYYNTSDITFGQFAQQEGFSIRCVRKVSSSNRSPETLMISPSDGAYFTEGTSITFSGYAIDLEEYYVNENSLIWTSDKDGQIGIGSSFTASSLSANTHVITMTATDGMGAAGSSNVTITVVAPQSPVTMVDITVQEGNPQQKAQLTAKPSKEIADNRIGAIVSNFSEWDDGSYHNMDNLAEQGFKHVEFSIQELEAPIDYSKDEFNIPPLFDAHIDTALIQNNITPTYILSFWDKVNHPQGWQGITSRFTTEEEILRYLDFVRFVVRHFKDRIQYYKLWNEPDNCTYPEQCIIDSDMIELIRRTVPVIRQEYPDAKIVVGGNIISNSQDYLFELLTSDIMPLVDVIDWQTMADGFSSEYYGYWRNYHSDYPNIIQQIKDTASAHGFQGEYRASELWWWFPGYPNIYNLNYPENAIIEVKNRTRGFVTQLGLDLGVRAVGYSSSSPIVRPAITNFFTTMAGAVPDSLTIVIEEAPEDTADIIQYSFMFQDNVPGVILWKNVEPQPLFNDTGSPVTIIFPGYAGYEATGIDVLHYFSQPLKTREEGEDLVIDNLYVKDYPVIVQVSGKSVSDVQSDFTGIPDKYRLHQNYPNPFKSKTTIMYELKENAQVSLKVYNIFGQIVETLVNDYKITGVYSVLWNASNVSSGLYFYRIEAGEYRETKKCLILK